MNLVVVTGPIAAGKSAVGRGLARRVGGAVIDLDRVYELLAPDPKSDEAVWSRARRLAGAMAAALFDEGLGAVVIEGEVWTSGHRAELLARVPPAARLSWITLTVPFPEALRRAQADPTRGLSRDPAFLRAQLDAFGRALPWLREVSEVIDTATLGEEAIVERLAQALPSSGRRRGD
jgi:shikimate kinase